MAIPPIKTTISQLNPGATLLGTERLAADQNGETVYITPNQIITLLGGANPSRTPTVLGNRSGNVSLLFTTDGNIELTATGDITIPNPVNPVPGTLINLFSTQNGTGGHGISFGSNFEKGIGAQLSPIPGATDLISMQVKSSGKIYTVIYNLVSPEGVSKLLSGALPPTNSQGADGDFYLMIDNASAIVRFYGPKLAGAWPVPYIVLQGAKGDGPTVLTSSWLNVGTSGPLLGAEINVENTRAFGVGQEIFVGLSSQQVYARILSILDTERLVVSVIRNVNNSANVNTGALVTWAGTAGAAATIALGDVTTGSPGSEVIVTNTGTPNAAELNFTIPAGTDGNTVIVSEDPPNNSFGTSGDVWIENVPGAVKLSAPKTPGGWPPSVLLSGQAATITINNVTTRAPGTGAVVTNVGTATDALLNIGIPAGNDGLGGVSFNRIGGMYNNAGAPGGIGFNAHKMGDFTGEFRIVAPAMAIKSLSSPWSAGSTGGLCDSDTTRVANTCYHIYVICKSDGSAGDYIASLSPTAPVLPTGYETGFFCRIGSAWTASDSNFVTFNQIRNITYLGAEFKALSAQATTTSAALINLFATNLGGVPTGIVVRPFIRVAGTGNGTLVTSPLAPDTAPNTSFGTGPFDFNGATAAAIPNVLTNTSGQIRIRSFSTGGTATMWVYGWEDIGLLHGV